MEALVSRLQAVVRDMCINLSGVDVAVPQHHLYRSQVRAVLYQCRREAVSQHVGRNMSQTRRFAITGDYLPELLAADRISAGFHEQQVGTFFSQQSMPCAKVILQKMDGRSADGYSPLFTSLPETTQRSRIKIQIRNFEAD